MEFLHLSYMPLWCVERFALITVPCDTTDRIQFFLIEIEIEASAEKMSKAHKRKMAIETSVHCLTL